MKTTLKILFVEDSEDDALIILNKINKNGYEVEYDRVDTAEAMKSKLLENTWDIILSDYKMPSFSGLKALALLKDTGIDIPFIIVSGLIGEDVAVDAMKKGAHDYIMKDNLQRLMPAIEREIQEGKNRNETQLLKKKEKEAEKHLKESEQRFREIFENSNDNIFLVEVTDDMRFRNLDFNPAFEKSTGRKRSELIGKFQEDVMPEEIAQFRNKQFRNCVETKESILNKEVKLPPQLGGGTFLFSIIPISNSDGKIYRIMGIYRDISEQKRIEEILAKRERDFRTLAENAPDPIIRYDRECRRIYVNAIVEKGSKIPIASLLGNTPADGGIVSSLESLKVMNSLQKVLKTGKRDMIEVLLVLPDGSELWMQNIHVPEFGPDGTVESVLSIGRNITERKQLEQHLKESFLFIEKIINSIPEPVFIKDREHRFILVNDAFCKFRGNTHKELIGKTDFDFYSKADAKKFWKEEELNFESGKESADENIMTDEAGKKSYVFVRKTAFTGSDGNKYLACTIHDITERKIAEEQLHQHEQEFRTLVENSPDVIVRYDKDCNRLYFNPSFQELADFQASELARTSPTQLSPLSADQAVVYMNTIKRVFETSLPQSMEIHQPYAGDELLYNMKAVPEFDKEGNITSVLAIARDVTELERSKQRSEMLSIAVDNSSDAIFIKETTEKHFSYVNQQACKSLGYTSEELYRLTIFDFVPDITKESIIKMQSETHQNNFLLFESRHKRKDGSVFPVEVTVIFFDYAGKSYAMNHVRDITERKHYQQNLEMLSHALNNASEAIFISEEKTITPIYVNDQACRSLGYSRAELLKMTIFDFDPDATQDILKQIDADIASGKTSIIESRHKRKDGTVFPVEITNTRYHHESKSYMMNIIQDISERKLAEKALRENEEKFSTVFRLSPASLAITRLRDNVFVDVNDVFLRDTGLTRDKVVGFNQYELDLGIDINIFEPLRSIGDVQNFEYNFKNRDGKTEYCLLSLAIITIAGEQCVLSQTVRITELKNKQNELIEANKAITESEQRLSKAELIASIGHIEYDFVNGMSYWSNGAFEVFNTPETMRNPEVPVFFEMVIHRDDNERVTGAMENAVKELTKFDEIYRIIDFTGNEKIIHGYGQVQIDQNSTPGNYFGIIQDITMMYNLNAQLFAEEEKFRLLAECSPVGIYISAGETPVYANKPMMDMAGVDSLGSLTDTKVFDLIHPEDRVKVYLLTEKLKQEVLVTSPYKLSLRKLSDDCTIRHYDVYVTTFSLHDVKHQQFIVVDKTEDYENEQIRQQLAASSLYIDQKNKLTSEIESTLKIILSSSKRFEKVDFQPVIDILRSYSQTDKDWELLKTHIENIHPEFVSILKKHCATLSVSDIKHCACIRLNLDTKEIARFFNVKPSSIQTSRVRLKKKFGLPDSTDLREFILSI